MTRRKGAGGASRIEARSLANVHATGERARRGMRSESRRVLILGAACIAIVAAAMVLPTYIFNHSLVQTTPAVIFDNISANLDNLIGVFTGDGAAGESRFMAVLVCAVSGAALGMCGSAYQGAFNNPLAAPKTLGVMSGGALGALVYVIFLQGIGPEMPQMTSGIYTLSQYNAWLSTLNPFEWLWINYGRCLCAMVGCFAVVGIVVALTAALGRGKLTNVVVIIFGQVFSATVTAIIAFARYVFTTDGGIDMADDLREIENYTMIISYDYLDLFVIVLPILICMVIVLAMRRRLTLLSFGDDEAETMGINVKRTRYAMIAVCTVMVAIAISFCGHVAFLGFISAHLARRIVGPDFRFLLPASLFTGSILLTIIQYICQSGLPYTSAYAAGTVCSIVGACLFMGIVIAQWGKGGSGGWR